MLRPQLILASASPRRLQLLQQAGITPDEIIPAGIDETPHKNEAPLSYVKRMAQEKAKIISARYPEAVVLAADTVVVAGRRILPKAEDEKTARECLEFLSGRRHRVYTAVCVLDSKRTQQAVEVTTVKFDRLVNENIEAYVRSNEWKGKAGGYAIQGLAERFIPWINGSFSNVVGLPVAKTYHMLRAAGVK